MSLNPERRVWLAWIAVASIFVLSVIFEVAFYGRLILHGLASWIRTRFPEPLGDVVWLFGHAPIAAVVGFVILLRTYESMGEDLPSRAIGVLVFLTLLSAYLGLLFAVNIFGE